MSQKSPSDIVALWTKLAKAKDATNIALLYASDAVLCATEGIVQGRDNIQNDLEQQFTAWTLGGISDEVDNVFQNWGWSYGTWKGTVTTSQGTADVNGSWSIVWVLDATSNWMIQQQSIITNPTNPPSQRK